jgi:Uma2 family endonuclease
MGRAQPIATGLSIAEYLERERAAEHKSEYYEGEIFAMAGTSYKHNKIERNILLGVGPCLLKKRCEIFSSNLRVHIPRTTLFTYPDLVIHCGRPVFYDPGFDTLLNPSTLIEILSPSTADYDRGTKFMLYREIDTLSEYVIVEQSRRYVERWIKRDTWQLATSAEPLTFGGCLISLEAIYEGVDEGAEAEEVVPA